jgi:hypothetical protein
MTRQDLAQELERLYPASFPREAHPLSNGPEINETFARRLRGPVSGRIVLVALRRLADLGHLELVRKDKAFHAAIYAKH